MCAYKRTGRRSHPAAKREHPRAEVKYVALDDSDKGFEQRSQYQQRNHYHDRAVDGPVSLQALYCTQKVVRCLSISLLSSNAVL